MFYRYGKKEKAAQAQLLKDLTRTVPATHLLEEEKRSLLLRQIKSACALDKIRFESLCLRLLHNFITYCQNLPEASASYYAHQGGVLDYALNRTEAALGLFKHYLAQGSSEEISEEQKLWQYALFSAAVLQGIGKLQLDYTINIYESNGQFLKQWNPLLESLASAGTHYSYEFEKESDDEFRRRLNLLLARTLMPASGFEWLASNEQVLATWLALLNEDPYSAGTLGAILIRADAIAVQRYLRQLISKGQGQRGRYGKTRTFSDKALESVTEIEQQLGVEFLQWLSTALEKGIIKINEAPLFMVPGGLLMLPEMFRLFMREHPDYKNWQAVQNGFLSLGLHQLSVENSIISRFEQSSDQKMHSGIVFANYAVGLPEKMLLTNVTTGKSTVVSAIELIHQAQSSSHYFTAQAAGHSAKPLTYLNATGQWQTEGEKAKKSMQLGITRV